MLEYGVVAALEHLQWLSEQRRFQQVPCIASCTRTAAGRWVPRAARDLLSELLLAAGAKLGGGCAWAGGSACLL